MQFVRRCLLVAFFLTPAIGVASPVIYSSAGCSVIHRDAKKVPDFAQTVIRVANGMGYKLFARDDAHGLGFKNEVNGRILTVGPVGPDGDFEVSADTPQESDVNKAGADTAKFARAFVAKFPAGTFSRPMKVCDFGPGV
jgi:hypothetical protein